MVPLTGPAAALSWPCHKVPLDITFEESVCFYTRHPHRGTPVPSAPLFLTPALLLIPLLLVAPPLLPPSCPVWCVLRHPTISTVPGLILIVPAAAAVVVVAATGRCGL
ncbi:unnamed protein product [Closterium sp. NIES-54]